VIIASPTVTTVVIRQVDIGKPTAIDASGSYDSDIIDTTSTSATTSSKHIFNNLRYDWSCQQAIPFPLSSCPGVVLNTTTSTATTTHPGQLYVQYAQPNTTSFLTLTLSDVGDVSRISQRTYTLVTVEAPYPLVETTVVVGM